MTLPADSRHVSLDLLRTFLTLLVVAHHAVLAYHPYAPPQESLSATPMAWTAYPIVDTQRWPGIEAFVHFNDTFFMALMFLISGVFAWPSLVRKGARGFVCDRARRLGLPFIVCAGLLAPLAYYPTYLVTSADSHLGAFWHRWLTLGVWPAGPAWFLWVLLVFGVILATAFAVAPGFGVALARLSERLSGHPIAYFGGLIALSALGYLPFAAAVGPGRWVSAGPFWLQISRGLHYFVYFFAGICLGVYGTGRGLLASDGRLARRWLLWTMVSLAAFALSGVTLLSILSTFEDGGPRRRLTVLGSIAFVLSCASSSFACLAVFVRFARARNRVLDSLNANAYGIFILHYVCVSWLQLMLLDAQLSGAAKALLVFVGAVALSWSLSAALRRIPIVGSVL